MTSPKKIAANRRNAQKSTGPRSTDGKARSRGNAYQHGLSIPLHANSTLNPELEQLARTFGNFPHGPITNGAAILAAEAQLEVERVRRARVEVIKFGRKRLARNKGGASDEELTCLAFAKKARLLATFDRYEARALGHRRRSLRAMLPKRGKK
jgi:hypothetical protein